MQTPLTEGKPPYKDFDNEEVTVKLDINRDLFSRALAKVQGVLSRKAAMPVLSNVYLSVDENGLMRLAASDLDVTYDGQLQCRCLDAGSVTVDGKRLFDVVRSLPGEEVHLETNAENQVTISCKNTEFVLLGHSVDSYPPLPDSEHVTLSNLDGFALKELLERTMLSISTDESRPNLNTNSQRGGRKKTRKKRKKRNRKTRRK